MQQNLIKAFGKLSLDKMCLFFFYLKTQNKPKNAVKELRDG